MNVLFFIRLLLRHILLLIAMPILLVILVFYLTKDQPKIYSSNTRVYTGIATGSSIVSMESSKLDLFATNAAFDNLINIIKLRTTMEEVSLTLLATHLMLEKPTREIISTKSYLNLMEIVPKEVRDLVVANNKDQTVRNLNEFKNSSYSNFIYELLNNNHPYYSSSKIADKLKVRRVQSSDLIEIAYESSDPGICKNTLDIICERFIENYTKIKVNQSDAVVNYFKTQIAFATEKLEMAENELLEFNQKNSIINYYEQTRHIAAEKELFNNKHLEIKLSNAGAARVIKVLEGKMSSREKKKITNQRIYTLRKELAQVNLDIAMKSFEEQAVDVDEKTMIEDIGNLRARAFDIEQELKLSVGEQYYIDNSTEGIPAETVLIEWVENVIQFESTKAQLIVAQTQNVEFDKLYASYAPMGATMKRLERKIDVAEKEYLSLLYSLGVAKLKQQNVELNSNLKIVSEPLFPIIAQPSKRKFLLAVAFLIGLFIPVFVIIVLEFLDRNIKSQARATDFIGLQVAAIFPNLARINRKIDVGFIKNKSLQIIARRLILNTEKGGGRKGPETNIIFSSLEAEGKTMLLLLLVRELSKIGYKVLFCTHNNLENEKGIDIRTYAINNSFHKIENVTDLVADFDGLNMTEYDYIFVELPGIRNNTYPINLFKNIGHSFMVTRANRAWTKADKYALNDILEHCVEKEPQVLLNGVEFQQMEDVLGDLPRKRSTLRKIIKDIFRLRFFSKSSLLSSRGKRRMKKRNYGSMFFMLMIMLASSAILLLAELNNPSSKNYKIKGFISMPHIKPNYEAQLFAEISQILDEEMDLMWSNRMRLNSKNILVLNQAPTKYYFDVGSFKKEENGSTYLKELSTLLHQYSCVKRSKSFTMSLLLNSTRNQTLQIRYTNILELEPDYKS